MRLVSAGIVRRPATKSANYSGNEINPKFLTQYYDPLHIATFNRNTHIDL